MLLDLVLGLVLVVALPLPLDLNSRLPLDPSYR